MLETRPRFSVTPSASRLTRSLRDIGYDFAPAVADIIDNSIAAGARRVDVEIEFDGPDSYVMITDDGAGMTAGQLDEALRFGTRRSYGNGELGRYGLGLKTASLSQCRSLTVVSRTGERSRARSVRTLDLDLIDEVDDWIVVDPPIDPRISRAKAKLLDGPGTVVLWRTLDRVLPERRPEGAWARRRLENLAERTAVHLAMVFHRYLEGGSTTSVQMTVNGLKVQPWNPFAPGQRATKALAPMTFELAVGDASGMVRLERYILPARDQFSSPAEFERLSGPMNWNRQQGLYIYRADRLVQWGGWAGIRGIDEHTKLARASLDFGTELDEAFNINVAKMRVSLPSQIRQMLEDPLSELCTRADDAYRKTARRTGETPRTVIPGQAERPAAQTAVELPPQHAVLGDIGLALRAAAMQAGEYAAFKKIIAALNETAPDVAGGLGLTG
ncbi:ATP-binding protein [Hamadaea sp. NPDC050747]|uniref:ATP-binding protein n=1 Tax=Hamadaea sp. NPDC050747 TaxID=3155789 RepID=UPI0033F5345C